MQLAGHGARRSTRRYWLELRVLLQDPASLIVHLIGPTASTLANLGGRLGATVIPPKARTGAACPSAGCCGQRLHGG